MCLEGQRSIYGNSHQKRNILSTKGQRGYLNSGSSRSIALTFNMQKLHVMMDTISAVSRKALNEPASNRFHL